MKIEGYPINLYKTQVEQEKLKKACIEFEAIFISKLFEGLRKTVDKSGFIDGGIGEEIFEGMLWNEYAKSMAKNQTLGIAEMLYKDMVRKGNLR